MLILNRKTEQAVVIGGDVCIRILAIEGDRVKIGIEAPVEIAVLREELLQHAGNGRNGHAAGVEAARTTGSQAARRARGGST